MKTSIKVLHWTPRILCILAILFISMFATDAFDSRLTLWQQIRDFVIHLIPSFILILFLVAAWKWERIGGIIFLVIGIGFSPVIYYHNFNMNQSVMASLQVLLFITLPFIVVGILFLLSYYMKKKYKLPETQDEN